MKLKQKILNGFDKLHLKIYEQQLFMTLDKSLQGLFPSEAFITQTLDNLNMADKKYTFIYNVNFLPFHINDDDWLAEYVMAMTKFKRDLKDIKISFDGVKKYIKTSAKFNALRKEYENNLVRAYIKKLLDENSDDFFLSKKEKVNFMKNRNLDQVFPEKVAKVMMAFGLSYGAIEEHIERNLDLWHHKTMHKTFYNRIEQNNIGKINREQRFNLSIDNPVLWESFASKELKFFQLWMLEREKKHYDQHKDTIDRVGTATANMKISSAQAYKLSAEVRQAHTEYNKVVNEVAREVNHRQISDTQGKNI